MSAVIDRYEALIRQARRKGFRTEPSGDGTKIYGPNGSFVNVHRTISDVRAWKNLRAQMAGIGIKLGYYCEHDDEQFDSVGALRAHNSKHHGVPTACDVCGEMFPSAELAASHKGSAHGKAMAAAKRAAQSEADKAANKPEPVIMDNGARRKPRSGRVRTRHVEPADLAMKVQRAIEAFVKASQDANEAAVHLAEIAQANADELKELKAKQKKILAGLDKAMEGI